MQTGENAQGLRRVMELSRTISLLVLLLHFYYYCFSAFRQWKWETQITDRLIANIVHTGIFRGFNNAKIIALGFLIISLIGTSGRKNENLSYQIAAVYFTAGL